MKGFFLISRVSRAVIPLYTLLLAGPLASAQVGAPVNFGIYGGHVREAQALALQAPTTRVFVSIWDGPNSVFYGDVDRSSTNPFAPGSYFFQIVPGLAASNNLGSVTDFAVHKRSGMVYANPGSGLIRSSVEEGTLTRIYNPDSGDPWVRTILIHEDRIFFASFPMDDVEDETTLCLNWADLDVQGVMGAVTTDPLFTFPGRNKAYDICLAVDTNSGRLLAALNTPTNYPFAFQLLASSNSYDALEIGELTNHPVALPAFVEDWLVTETWSSPPLTLFNVKGLGATPDGRWLLAGAGEAGQTLRVTFSADQGTNWGAEVDTEVENRYDRPGVVFRESEGDNYYVYVGKAVSTNKGGEGTWWDTWLRGAAGDPEDPNLLYAGFEQRGIFSVTNAASGWLSTNEWGETNLVLNMTPFNEGVAAVVINDFDFTADKRVAWTASGSGLRVCTNFADEAKEWSEPIFPMDSPNYEALAIDPNDPLGLTVYAECTRMLQRTTDGGVTWTGLYDHVQSDRLGRITTVRVHPTDSNLIVVGSVRDTGEGHGLLWYSEDYGVNWTNFIFPGGHVEAEVNDLLFVGDDLFVATGYHSNFPAVHGLYRVETSGGLAVTQEYAGEVHVLSMTRDSSNKLYAVALTTNWTPGTYSFIEDNPPLPIGRSDGGEWSLLPVAGLPDNAEPAQQMNLHMVVGRDEQDREGLFLSFGRHLYRFEGDEWVRVYSYPRQTALQVLKWDELTLGKEDGLYGQDMGIFSGVEYFVSPFGLSEPPYTNWVMAATNIQDAVDAAVPGSVIWVTNGIYAHGGRLVEGHRTRVAVDNYKVVRSVNGPDDTVIVGAPDPEGEGGLGSNAVRCAYVVDYGKLSGFTLTNGFTALDLADEGEDVLFFGGGAWITGHAMVSNCAIGGCGAMSGGGAALYCSGYLLDSYLFGNRAESGGGAALVEGGLILQCRIYNNEAEMGGGVQAENGGLVSRSCVFANVATNGMGVGGGVFVLLDGLVEQTAIYSNLAFSGGGGVLAPDLDEAPYVCDGKLRSCLLYANRALGQVGGLLFVCGGHAVNCTLAANTAEGGVGGVCGTDENLQPAAYGRLLNTIVYFNAAPDIASVTNIRYCCAPSISGEGNRTEDPHFSSPGDRDFRPVATSVCVNAGFFEEWMDGAADLDGRPRVSGGVVDMGAYEKMYWPIAVSYTDHGDVDPTGTVWIMEFGFTNFLMRPDVYYHVGDVLTNSISAGAVTNLLWTGVEGSGTLHAVFTPNLAAQDVPEWWLAQYGWTNDFDAAVTNDADKDGLTTGAEYAADTNPTNRDSCLRLHQIGADRLEWVGGTAVVQYVERSGALVSNDWTVIWTNLPPTALTNGTSLGESALDAYFRIRATR